MAKPRIPGFMELGGSIATPYGFLPTNAPAGQQYLANEGAADVANINASSHLGSAAMAAGASMFGSAETAGAHRYGSDVTAKAHTDAAGIHAKGLLDATTQQGFNRGYELELGNYLNLANMREYMKGMGAGGNLQNNVNADLGIGGQDKKKKPGNSTVATPGESAPAAPMGLDAFYEQPTTAVAAPGQAQAPQPSANIKWDFGAAGEAPVDTSLLDRTLAQRRAAAARSSMALPPLALPGLY